MTKHSKIPVPPKAGQATLIERVVRNYDLVRLAPVAEFTPKTVQTEQLRADLVYRLRVTVDDPHGELRQGQPVTVTVSTSGKR